MKSIPNNSRFKDNRSYTMFSFLNKKTVQQPQGCCTVFWFTRFYLVKSTSFRLVRSTNFKNGNQIIPTITISTNCKMPPKIELVAKIPLITIGTVQGTETPVGAGTIPAAITK